MTAFSITYDYRCPFARIAHLHVLEALESGAEWDVSFLPFSLRQMHIEVGEPSVWDQPELDSALTVLQASTVVRDRFPERFNTLHRRLFDLRHVDARDLRDDSVIAAALTECDIDADAVFDELATGTPLEVVRNDHEGAVERHQVWGVPTFLVGDEAVFVRLMEPPEGDATLARRTIERILDMVGGWPQLNEFKHTRIRR
jgi:hypothetical protein